MTDVTRILNAIEQGDIRASDELLPLVYEELRIIAARKMSHEPPGQTLQATALVHEAFIRLVGDEPASWDSRDHFFLAAAEAMRRILVENARRKKSKKQGKRRKVKVQFLEVSKFLRHSITKTYNGLAGVLLRLGLLPFSLLELAERTGLVGRTTNTKMACGMNGGSAYACAD